MTQFITFALYLCLGALLLIIAPVMMHPTLPLRRKIAISLVGFMLLVPGGLLLYGIFGAPQLAALHP